ncbi:integrase [Bacteriophage sp.]|nr:integrase [Bacteriophage sp.]
MRNQPYTYQKDGSLYVRVPFRDPRTGKWRSKRRKVGSQREARDAIAELKTEIKALTPTKITGESLTVESLFQIYTRPFPKFYRDAIVEHFGAQRFNQISYEDLAEFKRARLAVVHRYTEKTRKLSTVNRELEALRRLFVFAQKRGFIALNPFNQGDSLINTADETKRDRIPTEDEITKLLEHAKDEREHLRPIILLALDTGLRKSKLLGITVEQLDLERGLLRLGESKSRTKRHPPIIGLTTRTVEALKLWLSDNPTDGPVFGKKDVKRSWRTLCRLAKVRGLVFHDLRHSFVTRSILAGLPQRLVMKIAGHTEADTFDRYLNVDEGIALHVAKALSDYEVTNSVTKSDQENALLLPDENLVTQAAFANPIALQGDS